MILDVTGKIGTEILQILNSELAVSTPKGTRVTLADLVQIAGVPSVNELPSKWAINNGVITGASDIEADLIPASTPADADLTSGLPVNISEGVLPAASTSSLGPREGTQASPYTIPELEGFSPELQTVATAGTGGTAAPTPVETPVPRKVELGIKSNVPVPAAPPSAFGTQTATTTTTTSQEQDLAKMENLLSEQLRISSELSNINLGKTQEEATAALEAISEIQANLATAETERQTRLKLQREREVELVAQVEAATLEYKNAEIDSERIWKKKGTGSRLLAAIAAGLGAYASAMTGTKNFALEIINNAISDDIEAQKAEIAVKGGVITEQRNLLNDLRNKGMSDQEAESAARVIMISQVEMMLQQKLAKIKGASFIKQGQLLQEQLNTQKEMDLERLKLNATSKVVTTIKEVPSAAQKLANARELAKQQALGRVEGKIVAERIIGLTDAEKRALSVDGYLGLAPTVEEAKKARDASKKMIEGIAALDNLVAKRKKHGFETDWFGMIPDADREAAKSDAILFLGMIKSKLFLDLGVLQEADVKLLAKAVPQDPLGVFREGPTLAQYQAIRDYMVKSGEIYFKTLGLTPQTGVSKDLSKPDLRTEFQQSAAAYN